MLASTVQSFFSELATQEHVHYEQAKREGSMLYLFTCESRKTWM